MLVSRDLCVFYCPEAPEEETGVLRLQRLDSREQLRKIASVATGLIMWTFSYKPMICLWKRSMSLFV